MNILSIIGIILVIGGVGGADLGTSLILVALEELFGAWLIIRNLDFSN